MKTWTKKIESRTYSVEEFDSILELMNVNQSRQVTDGWKDDCLTEKEVRNDSSWYGVNSIEQAYNLMKNGWEEGTKKISNLVDKVSKQGFRSKTKFVNNVYGFSPVVPLALMGVPNSMLDVQKESIKSKVVTVIYDNTASCGVSSEDIIEAGKNLVSSVINLEMSGYRVEVKILISCCDRGNYKHYFSLTTVKKANQSLNLKKMMYPMAHSSFLRVVGFDWQDKTPIGYYQSGRGCALYVAEKEGAVKKEDYPKVFGENVHVITYKQAKQGSENLEEILKTKVA